MNSIEFNKLLKRLVGLPTETEWVELKQNYADFEEIGRNLSALANSAALLKKPRSYIIWGIENKTHTVLGTSFSPREARVGNEELENWLVRLLEPRIDFRMYEDNVDGKYVVLFEVPPATHCPVRFSGTEYIRVGSYTKKLRDYPEKEKALWKLFDRVSFEQGIAKEGLSPEDVLRLLDYQACLRLLKEPLPDNISTILQRLSSNKIILAVDSGMFNITNLGAILFAQNLNDFDRLSRKALRIIIYKGANRVRTLREVQGGKGYAIGFEGAIEFINEQLPQSEEIGQALRKEVRLYPEIAIRELVANALIHQDFEVSGSGPKVEIFNDRMEVTNSGKPLIETLRFIDEPPRSRNEALASLMRRMGICEERGSGIDKVIFQVEVFQLPPPDFRVSGDNTIAVLFGPRQFSDMNRDERIRACYQHACLQYVSNRKMSNATLRKRLGIKESNYPMASRIIKDAIKSKLIKPYTIGSKSIRDAAYLPFWA